MFLKYFPAFGPNFFTVGSPTHRAYAPRIHAGPCVRRPPQPAAPPGIDAVPCVRLPPAHVLMDGKESNQLRMHVTMFN